jgi:hypothetical protein
MAEGKILLWRLGSPKRGSEEYKKDMRSQHQGSGFAVISHVWIISIL